MIKKLQESKQFEHYFPSGYTVKSAMQYIEKKVAQCPFGGAVFVHHSQDAYRLRIDNWISIKETRTIPKTLKIGNTRYEPWTVGKVSQRELSGYLQEIAAYNFGLWNFGSDIVIVKTGGRCDDN